MRWRKSLARDTSSSPLHTRPPLCSRCGMANAADALTKEQAVVHRSKELTRIRSLRRGGRTSNKVTGGSPTECGNMSYEYSINLKAVGKLEPPVHRPLSLHQPVRCLAGIGRASYGGSVLGIYRITAETESSSQERRRERERFVVR